MPVNTDSNTVIDEPAAPEGETLPINELFCSLQGEGIFSGMPSVFIRTSGCNLRCWFCDSYHTSWEPTHAWLSIDDIIREVTQYEQPNHIVLTGGEPLIHEESVELLNRLGEAGYHTTVETNGTIYREAHIDLASISPKLANSTPTSERDPKGNGELEQRHDERRIDLDELARLIDAYDFQLKFVITGHDDIPEINDLLEDIRGATRTEVKDTDVLLMPEGMTTKQLAETREITAELAIEHGYRYTPRLHVNLWNDAPGR